MKRAVIIAKGEVQRVGYRDTVEKIARKLKLTGFVENLKPLTIFGFTHFCDKTRRGKFKLGRKTSRKKFRQRVLDMW